MPGIEPGLSEYSAQRLLPNWATWTYHTPGGDRTLTYGILSPVPASILGYWRVTPAGLEPVFTV